MGYKLISVYFNIGIMLEYLNRKSMDVVVKEVLEEEKILELFVITHMVVDTITNSFTLGPCPEGD